MRQRNLLWVFCLFFYALPLATAQFNTQCIDDATISMQGQDGNLLLTCQGDGIPDQVRFTTSDLSTPFGHVLTDDAGKVILVQISNTIDFENVPPGSYRLYAFSFIGQVLVAPGDNVFTDELASICYALTTNYIRIQPTVPDGGTVAADEGNTTVYVCPGDGVADIVGMTTTSDGPLYAYIITDENNIILNASLDDELNFDGAPEGTCHVWGVAYVGELNAVPGEPINSAELADECFDLSDNFVSVIRTVPVGGSVSLNNGEDNFLGCEGAAGATILTFVNQTTSPAPYTFVLTDENNEILLVLDGNTLDLDDAPLGHSRLWGLSYTGELLATPGTDAAGDDLSDDCYDLSDNFVAITKRQLDAGSVSLDDGDTSVRLCVGDGVADEITVVNTGDDADEYIYIITNTAGEILDFSDTGVIDFDNTSTGTSRVYGLAYSGNLTAETGDDIGEIDLSDECFQLSDNFITVTKLMPEGGEVTLSSGDSDILVCTGDGIANELTFVAAGNGGGDYIFVVTDENNIILNFSVDGVIDFEGADAGICRVWGLAYTGNLTAEVGDNAATTDLSDECFDLSDNFVTVNRTFVDGATVSLESGATEATICANDPAEAVLNLTNTTSSTETYIFVVTTEAGEILSFSTDGTVDFFGAGPGVALVWGLSYSGDLTAAVGDNANVIEFSDECFELSSNVVTVTRFVPEAGAVSLSSGETETAVCTGDGAADELTIVADGNSGGSYIFVITDENNIILSFSTDDVIDFEGADAGICRVWGLAYTGNLTAAAGDNAAATALSDGCFDLSENFVTVNRTFVDGGTVSLESGMNVTLICANNPDEAVLNFINTTSSTENYIFVVTTATGEIVSFSTSGTVDFAGTGSGVNFVWGLSYSGNLVAELGDNIGDVELSDDCHELSANAVTVSKADPEASTVSLSTGGTTAVTCNGDNQADVLTIVRDGPVSGFYLFLVTDADSNVVAMSSVPNIDFASFADGVHLVWGFTYTGSLTLEVGDNLATAEFSTSCFDLSDNFITVNRTFVDGGTVSLESGDTEITICTNDPEGAMLNFNHTSTSTEAYIFVVTTEAGEILSFSTDGNVDFSDAGSGISLVWGLSYSGNLTAAVGDNAAAAEWSDGCFELSSNFVTVTHEAPQSGTIALSSGATTTSICVGDGLADLLTFEATGNVGANYIFIVTDNNGQILGFSESGEVDFEDAGDGVSFVWGLAYTGTLTAQVGDNLLGVALADGCYSLTDSPVTINQIFVDGGVVGTEEGILSTVICSDDDPDILTLTFDSESNELYTFLVTDFNNNLLFFLTGNVIDFNQAAPGTYRVWGLSYSGDLTAQISDNISDTPLSDQCFDLSENFIDLRVELVDGGLVAMADGGDEIFICPGDGNPDIVSFDSTGVSTGEYTYVITDSNNNILNFPDGDEFDFDAIPEGTYLVWGLAYTGELAAAEGDDITATGLSDECYDLSDNFITVTSQVPTGGTIATEAGETTVFVCTSQGSGDDFFVELTTDFTGPYLIVLTDDTNEILSMGTAPGFSFNGFANGVYRLHIVAYTGDFTGAVGDNLFSVFLSDDCYDISDNFITVNVDDADGGTVATEDGETVVYTCPNDGNPDVISFDSIAASNSNYIYIITDENNATLAILDNDEFDFDNFQPGNCRVWGLAYTGNIIIGSQSNIFESSLSDDCYDLSDNFISVVRQVPEAGSITSPAGPELTLCVGDGSPDDVVFEVTGASAGNYAYLITDSDGFLLTALLENHFDFENASGGNCRIYGLAYTGQLIAIPGDNVEEVDLSTDCFDLTDDFIQLHRIGVDGSIVFSEAAVDSTIYICAGDGVADNIIFLNGSLATDGEYNYAITTENNVILSILPGNEQNFENTGFTRLRVFGISYTGELSVTFGDTITTSMLSDSCYDLSDNFLTVVMDLPEGGMVSTADGDSTLVCPGATDGFLTVTNSSTSQSGYFYLLTDTADVILSVETGSGIDFNDLEPGFYHVWGVSFTGLIAAEVGDTVTQATLATSCFELSENLVVVERGLTVDPGIISDFSGLDTIYSCPSNDIADLIAVMTTSADTNYQYVITDTLNNIVIPDISGNVVDFDEAAPGIYRIYGIAYNGVFTAAFGQNVLTDPLSDACAGASENFITVVHLNPDGGTVTTAEGEIAVSVVAGDGIADSISFVAVDATPVPFVFVVTNEANEVLAILDDNVHDFEDAGVGTCRVWGLAYTGTLTVVVGDTLTTATLSDDCFDLSNNFVQVVRMAPFDGNETVETSSEETGNEAAIRPTIRVKVAPNPAGHYLDAIYELKEPQSEYTSIQLVSATGQIILSEKAGAMEGLNTHRFDLSSLPAGMYVLYVRNGEMLQWTKFIKR